VVPFGTCTWPVFLHTDMTFSQIYDQIVNLLPDEKDPVDMQAGNDAQHGHDGEGQDQATVSHATYE
jgi:hypothetical protein